MRGSAVALLSRLIASASLLVASSNRRIMVDDIVGAGAGAGVADRSDRVTCLSALVGAAVQAERSGQRQRRQARVAGDADQNRQRRHDAGHGQHPDECREDAPPSARPVKKDRLMSLFAHVVFCVPFGPTSLLRTDPSPKRLRFVINHRDV